MDRNPPAARRERRSPSAAFADACMALAFGLALAARLVGLAAPFDRQFDGFQGAFFALAAVGYERFDPHPAWPYPLVHVDAPDDLREHGYLYANHPPFVPLLAHATLALAGPAGWDEAWRDARAPQGIEGPLRTPFAAAQVGAALALAFALARLGARRQGLAAAALLLALPGPWVYAGLVNYENPGLFALGLVVVASCAVVRRGAAGALALVALFVAGAFAASVTYAPLLFAPPLAVWMWARLGRRALAPLAALGAGAGAGLAAHAALAAAAYERMGRESAGLAERARELVAPLLDGTLPFPRWLAVQWRVLADHVGLVPLALAAAGLLAYVRRPRAPVSAGLGAALLAGGALVQLAFYRHTGDPQEPFALWWAPGVAVLAGALLAGLVERGRPLIAALLFATAAVGGMLGGERLAAPWRDVSPRDPGPRELGADLAMLAPPGSVVWHADAFGWTPAVAFYAWRTLAPVAPPDYAVAVVRAQGVGLGAAPVYVAEPLASAWDVAPAALEQSRRMVSDLVAHDPDARPVAEGTYFRLWPVR